MPGETDLHRLLARMKPILHEGEIVVCTLPDGAYGDLAELAPLAAVQEREGLTLVLLRERADEAGLAYEDVFARVTLTVRSSLQAVGLTAAVAGRLADCGISANVLAAYFHDHLLVSRDRADEALRELRALSAEAAAGGVDTP